MTVLYTAYLPRVLPYIRDCADIVAVAAIRDAAIEFCQRTFWLTDDVSTVSVAGEDTYALTPTDAFTEAVWVREMRYAGYQLRAGSADNNNAATDRDWPSDTGNPRQFIAQLDMSTVRLWPTPDVDADEITMVLAVAPTRDSTGAADVLFDRWVEDIALGARARLHEQSNAPYYDIKAADQTRRRFNHAIGRASIIRRQTPGSAPMVMRPPRFY